MNVSSLVIRLAIGELVGLAAHNARVHGGGRVILLGAAGRGPERGCGDQPLAFRAAARQRAEERASSDWDTAADAIGSLCWDVFSPSLVADVVVGAAIFVIDSCSRIRLPSSDLD